MTRSCLTSLFCLSQARQPATLSTAFVCRTQVDLMDLTLAPSDAVDKHHRRLFRLACHKRRTQELAQWLSAQGLLTPRLARLPHCRSWMIFRHYPELDLIRLSNPRPCDLNLLLLSRGPLNPHALSAEWQTLTHDSYITYCQPRETDPRTFIEIFKYALKFSDLSYPDTFHVYEVLSHRKLMGSFGAFRGLS